MIGNSLSSGSGMRQLQAALLVLAGIGGTLFFGLSLGASDTSRLVAGAIVLVLGLIAAAVVGNWRRGIYFIILWVICEDLVRKYLGNSIVIYLAKDALVAVAYLVFLYEWRQGRVQFFRPSFLVPFVLVLWISIAQMLNPISPSPIYGIVGFKLYFYYAPLMFLSYALIDSERDLQRFLVINLAIASIVATIGIIQSIVGPEFLNPQTLASELEALNRLFRQAPEVGVRFYRPPGVFLSDGRFGWYLTLLLTMSYGTILYFIFARKNWKALIVPLAAFGLCVTALTMSGSRGSFMMSLISLVILTFGALIIITQHKGARTSLFSGLALILGAGMVGLLTMAILYPTAFEARWQFYTQTLLPGAEASELVYRSWDFPMSQFMANVSAPWSPIGYGIGNASQALLYVPSLFGVPLPDTPRAGESGFGAIAAELGYLGLFLWLVWTGALLYSGSRIVYQLRRSPLFPISFALFWVVVIVMVFFLFGTIMSYQNFVNNIYLWLCIGILFKLPKLLIPDDTRSNDNMGSHSNEPT